MGKELIDYPNTVHHRQQHRNPYRKTPRRSERSTLVGEHSGVSRTIPSWQAGRLGCSTQTNSITQRKRLGETDQENPKRFRCLLIPVA